jgi:hypothetical protein
MFTLLVSLNSLGADYACQAKYGGYTAITRSRRASNFHAALRI